MQIDLPAHSPLRGIVKNYIQVCTGMPAISARQATHSSQALVETVTLALLTHSPTNSTVVHTGKLIDKLVAMEPELIGSCPDLQVSQQQFKKINK